MWQMLRWLFQWFNKFLQSFFGSQQSDDFPDAKEYKVVELPPELTNTDLELLFTQLLEGVHQARGQQWVLKYLQRMEDRISTERWIDWLLMFGERLLSSPAPNHQLAVRMVQLGELEIGSIGELAYDIGIRLLRRNLAVEDDVSEEQNQVEEETITPIDGFLDTPGQKLLRDLGERLWNYEEEFTPLTPAPQLVEESVPGNAQEFIFEFVGLDVPIRNPAHPPIVAEVDEISNLDELVAEDEELTEITVASSLTEIVDHALVSVEPKLAYTIDELLVRLEQSTDLVQQLAAELAIQKSDRAEITVTNQAQTWFYKGLQQAKIGNLLGAVASYNQAIALNPDCYEYWFNHALTLCYLKRYPEAIASYDQAINLKPDFAKAWYNRGSILGELGDFDAAVNSFDQAVAIKPNYQEAWSSRGLGLLKLGMLWEAIASYDQALTLEPQDPETWYYRGVALAVSEQYEEAIASYDQALTINPDYQEVWIDRGVVLFNLKQWSEAITSWDKALSIQPDFYLAWFNRGVALDNLGEREAAIASYEQAINIKPDFHVAWYNQAVALFYLNRFTEAIACYDSALEIKLDYWEAWIGRGTAAGHLVTTDTAPSLVKSLDLANLGGYAGKIASYTTGLTHLRPDTHPEGWGRLHLALGNSHYDQGKKQPTPREYWHKAAADYQQALLTLTPEDFPQLHLEVLQSLVKVLVSLGETETAQELQQQGIKVLQQLLNDPTRPDESKQQLALKFTGLGQLAVDLVVNVGDLVEAWEIAEYNKNSCLTWLMDGWQNEIYTPNYGSIQQLLNPNTAIVYWHLSPAALHTFILKDQAPSPILLFTPIQNVEVFGDSPELPLPEAVRRLVEFENWLEDWQQQYQEYHHQDAESQENHSWQLQMAEKLLQLKNILSISTISQELEGITKLILIPHRDLYKLPLHSLFYLSTHSQEELPNIDANCTISYLPSIQVGISLPDETMPNWQQQLLLSIEQPNNSYPPLKFARLAVEIVSQMFTNPQRISGLQATKDYVENALLADYNICHFIGQSVNNLSEPKKSALLLAAEDKLTLEDICQHNLTSYNLFILAANASISHHIHNISSEYLGLETGLLSRGVPYVVSTIWNVESSASALVLIEFYRRLQQNKSPVTALAEATLWLREITTEELTKWHEDLLQHLHPEEFRIRTYLATQLYKSSKFIPGEKIYSHPYYWAAFTITGKPN
jgi:CHAT domain-containing protein/tetratricopeptide (TPR) repeat protein